MSYPNGGATVIVKTLGACGMAMAERGLQMQQLMPAGIACVVCKSFVNTL